MRTIINHLSVLSVLSGLTLAESHAVEGLGERIPWTTSRIRGTPDPPPPYRTQRAFPKLTFDAPLVLKVAPDTGRLYVAEQYGKIYSFVNQPDVDQVDLCLDVESSIFGFALHPKFAENGYIYVTYLNPKITGRYLLPEEETPLGSRVSRFQLVQRDPPRCDPNSEEVIFQWRSGGHNGGCIVFGPDGYLYLATGDSGDLADPLETGQDLSNPSAAILRIDVDRPESGNAYGIPKDNPFVNVAGARPEIWAYGLRQAWKMSFDRATGELWCGDVGQDLWESVHRIQRGGNYGWSVTEGSHAFRPERKRGPTPILPPVYEYNHTEGRSVTGGYVYHGSRLDELVGAYIFADYDSGQVWGLRYDGHRVTWHEELADTRMRIVEFGEDREGEVYLVDHIGGGLHRLVRSEESTAHEGFPRKLSQTGLFSSVSEQTPAPGVIPFSINARAWLDGAHKEWFLAIPGMAKIEFDGIEYPDPEVPAGWKFPDGSVMVETIGIEMETGKPASRRRLETRILHHRHLPGSEEMGDQYWMGYTYIWNDDQTDAILLENPNGLDRTFTIRDPTDSDAPGDKRQMTWHFPSRAECIVCHNMAAKYVISANTFQLNKDHDYGGGQVVNQIRAYDHWGLFTEPLPAPPEQLPRVVNPEDDTKDFNRRARAYLHANCAFCHRKWGGGNADFKLVYSLDIAKTRLMGVRPGHGTFNIQGARLVAPGDPFRSILFYRMAKVGSGRMPRAGSQTVDARGLYLVHDWIAQLPSPDRDGPNSSEDGSAAIREELKTLRDRSTTMDARNAAVDRLLGSTLGALALSWAVENMPVDSRRREIIHRGAAQTVPDVRDLFERFLPAEQRTKRLGEVIDPNKILALSGSAARGRELFLAAGIQCKSCHRIHGTGVELGPDLSEIGKKYPRVELLETVLEPSKKIEPKWVSYLLTTAKGKVYSGLLIKRTPKETVLRTAENETIRLTAEQVETIQPQKKSFMPDQLLRDLTARDAADLLAYLSSLK